jgi:hypothetical protein
MPLRVEAVEIAQRQRPWSNEAHVAFEHVNELRQLIDAETSQEFAKTGYPRIPFDFEDRTGCFIEMLEFRLRMICPINHRSEFYQSEKSLIESDPLLRKENGTGRIFPDEPRDNGK